MTKVGDFDWNELVGNEDRLPVGESEGDSGSRFRQANEPDFIPLPSTLTPITPMPVSVSAPIDRQAWQSNAIAKRRQVLTLATVAIAGTLFAVVGFFAFIRMVGTKGTPIGNAPVVAPKLPELSKDPTDVPKEPEPGTSLPIAPENERDASNVVPTESSVPPTESSVAPEKGLTVLPGPQGNEPGPVKSAANPVAKEDDEATAAAAFGSSIPEWLLGNNSPIRSIDIQDNRATELNIEEAEVNRDQQFHPQASTILSWDKNSKDPIPSFQAKEISLLRCIDVFSQMSGIGITIDWESCRIAGVDITKNIELSAANKSVAEMMEQLVRENGLIWTMAPTGLPIISASQEAMESRTKNDWPITPLFETGAAKQACEDLIKLWGYDDVCHLVEDKLHWSEQATPFEKANLHTTLCLLAKLRNQDAGQWTQVPDEGLVFSPGHWNKSFQGFKRRIDPNIVAPEKRPIGDLLMLAAAKTKLHLVIDWPNVYSHGLSPVETAASVLRGRDFSQVTKRFLNSYALELVPIGEEIAWLTTREVRRRLLRVIPLRLPKNSKVDDLRQNLRALAPVVDDVSKFRVIPVAGTEDLFFARICTPIVDQLNDPDIMFGLGWPDR